MSMKSPTSLQEASGYPAACVEKQVLYTDSIRRVEKQAPGALNHRNYNVCCLCMCSTRRREEGSG